MEKEKYQPVNCAFYDYFEHFATLRKPITICYRDMDGTTHQLGEALITDLSGGRNGEFLHILYQKQSLTIRADYIVSVDEIRAADFPDSCSV